MNGRLAIADDEEIVRKRLRRVFSKHGFQTETFSNGAALLVRMKQEPFDVVLLDLCLPDYDGLDLLVRIKNISPDSEVVIMTGYASIETAVQSIKMGAYHYITKPLKLRELHSLVDRAMEKRELRIENRKLREMLKGKSGLERIIGKSPAMMHVFDVVKKVASVNCNILLQGESGTGKELLARAIHELSPRKNHAFVTFNCGGFTDDLISSELCGYEKDAFPGAHTTKIGLMESANGGTLFLNEVDELSQAIQVKLYRIIDEKSMLRIGGTRAVDLDVRIIAASSKNLKQEVTLRNFREDLYFRLNVVKIKVPPLRERNGDISLLISHFIEKYGTLFGKIVKQIEKRAEEILLNYSFPGNVRELENIVERAVALTDSDVIRVEHLPLDLRSFEVDSFDGEGLLPLEEVEKRYIEKVLKRTSFNKSLATQILKVPRTTLWRKMKKYRLYPKLYQSSHDDADG